MCTILINIIEKVSPKERPQRHHRIAKRDFDIDIEVKFRSKNYSQRIQVRAFSQKLQSFLENIEISLKTCRLVPELFVNSFRTRRD